MSYFVQHGAQQLGPFSEAEVKARLASGEISAQDFIWWEGQAEWKPIAQTSLGAGAPPVPSMPPAPGIPAQGKVSQLAVASLVCGILGFVFSLIAGIPAVIMGHMSLNQIRRDPSLRGHGIALAGTILGYLTVAVLPLISIIAISVLIALGNQVKSVFTTINSQIEATELTNSPATTNSAPANP